MTRQPKRPPRTVYVVAWHGVGRGQSFTNRRYAQERFDELSQNQFTADMSLMLNRYELSAPKPKRKAKR